MFFFYHSFQCQLTCYSVTSLWHSSFLWSESECRSGSNLSSNQCICKRVHKTGTSTTQAVYTMSLAGEVTHNGERDPSQFKEKADSLYGKTIHSPWERSVK